MFCIPDEVELKTAMKLKQCILLENVNILQLSRDELDINLCVCVFACMLLVVMGQLFQSHTIPVVVIHIATEYQMISE